MNDAPQDDWLQAARMEALEAEVRRLQSVENALMASQAEVERLNDALDDYGEHQGRCAMFDYPTKGRCTCGLADAFTPHAAPEADTSGEVQN